MCRLGHLTADNVIRGANMLRLLFMTGAALKRVIRERDRLRAALIRIFLRQRVAPLPPLSADPLGRMVGQDDFEPAPIDGVVYR
jgi:hypothetical protein